MTDFAMTRGDSRSFEVGVTRLNSVTNVREPVTPEKAWFTIKQSVRDPDVDALVSINSTDDPSNVLITAGTVHINLEPSHTATFTQRWVVYDVQIREADGTISTVEEGFIEMKKDVTLNVI